MNRAERRSGARKLRKPPAGKKWSWTQSICDTCWVLYGDPFRDPVRIRKELREREQCGWCGNIHSSGIYSRADPAKVPYPRLEWNDEIRRSASE
jgi:hypothetical protein